MFSHSWRGSLLFALVLVVLILSFFASLLLRGTQAWAVGLIYIAYDTFLLSFMVVSSWRAVRAQEKPQTPYTGPLPTVSVLICAKNERLVLPACLHALRNQTTPAEEILVLSDGSIDLTLPWLTETYALEWSDLPWGARLGQSHNWPGLRVLDKPNSGKADSLNRGWVLARGEIVVTLDADTVLEPGALAALREAFARDADLGIADGVLRPVCSRSPWARFFQFYQTFEYARGFLWRLTWMNYRMLILVSGAFASYRRTLLEKVGGFDAASWVEDYELTHRVYREAARRGETVRVKTISGARGTTDAPGTTSLFLNQRRRWFGGFIATHFQYGEMVGNGRYGRVGRYMLCLKTLDLLLPVYGLAALVTLVIILLLRHGLAPFILKLILAKLAFDLVMHATSVRLYQRWLGYPGQLGRSLWVQSLAATLTEPIVFQVLRQLGAVLGWLAYLRQKQNWRPQRVRKVEVRRKKEEVLRCS